MTDKSLHTAGNVTGLVLVSELLPLSCFDWLIYRLIQTGNNWVSGKPPVLYLMHTLFSTVFLAEWAPCSTNNNSNKLRTAQQQMIDDVQYVHDIH